MKITRTLTMIFTAVLVAASLASCGSEPENPDTVSDTSTAEVTTLAEPEELTPEQLVEKKIAELPKESYDGAEFRFFVRSPAYHKVWCSKEIYAEEEINEPINDAVYRRNRKVEEIYDINIAETGCSSSALAAEVRTLILAGDDELKVFIPSLTTACLVAGEDLFYNLDDIPNLDLDSPWWDKTVDQMAIGGNRYFTIGDLMILDKQATRGIHFNKKIIGDYNLENPYELVDKNEWTVDKMYEMMKAVSEDTDSDGKRTELDMHGLMYYNNSMYSQLNALGATVAALDAENMPVITINDDYTQKAFTKLFEVLYDRNTSYNIQSMMFKKSGKTTGSVDIAKWEAGKVLFWEVGFNNLDWLRASEVDFGIVPYPKYDAEQDFHSAFYIGGPSALCIPVSNNDLEMTGTIVEALCAYSSITLRPAYYETCIQGKYTRDEESVAMLDIIFANRVYDLAIINICGKINTALDNLAAACSTNIASTYAKIQSAVESDLDKITEAYLD